MRRCSHDVQNHFVTIVFHASPHVASQQEVALAARARAGGAEGAGLLWVVNAEGCAACVAQAAWRILAPRIALQAAELRQVALASCLPHTVSNRLAWVALRSRSPHCLTRGAESHLARHVCQALPPVRQLDDRSFPSGQLDDILPRRCLWSATFPNAWRVQAAVAMGAAREEGAEVALLVAGVPAHPGDPDSGLAPLFRCAFYSSELQGNSAASPMQGVHSPYAGRMA